MVLVQCSSIRSMHAGPHCAAFLPLIDIHKHARHLSSVHTTKGCNTHVKQTCCQHQNKAALFENMRPALTTEQWRG